MKKDNSKTTTPPIDQEYYRFEIAPPELLPAVLKAVEASEYKVLGFVYKTEDDTGIIDFRIRCYKSDKSAVNKEEDPKAIADKLKIRYV